MRRTRVQGLEAKNKTWKGGGGAKMLTKPHTSCRRDGGNGRDLGGKRKNVNKSVGSVAAASYNLENRIE